MSALTRKYKPTEREREIMLHALGLDRSKKAYRNYYIASKGHHSYAELENLVTHGLMRRCKELRFDSGGILYHVTDDGKKVLGV